MTATSTPGQAETADPMGISAGLASIKERRQAAEVDYLVGCVLQVPRDDEAPILRAQRHQRVKAAIRAYPSTSMFQWGSA